VAFLLWVCLTVAAHGEDPSREVALDEPGPDVPPSYRKVLQATVDEARTKLLQASCLNVLGDFVDGGGGPLVADLVATGQSAADFLARIHFSDGRWSGSCAVPGIFAWTHPGSHAVHLCLDRFAQLAHANPSAAANLLIHEELHALGLREDPPSSRVITARVAVRCGP
jgi:hypothetical protein